jgi:hypothetical protein
VRLSTASSGQSGLKKLLSSPKAGGTFAGGSPAKVGWSLASGQCGRGQPSHGFHEGRDPGKEIWLLIEWPEKTAEPTRYFICDLPADYSLDDWRKSPKPAGPIEQDCQQLMEELGLDHYEGRSCSGHVKLVMLAHSFLTLETMSNKNNLWVDPAEDAP